VAIALGRKHFGKAGQMANGKGQISKVFNKFAVCHLPFEF
jgi:hypothetical protein